MNRDESFIVYATIGFVLALCLYGCGEVQIKRVSKDDWITEGYRVAKPIPCLSVGQTGIAEVIYLPDDSDQYAIVPPRSVVGSTQIAFSLKDGWMLSSIDSKTDTGISGLISSASSLISVIPKAMQPEAHQSIVRTDLAQGLYRIDVANNRLIKMEAQK